MSVGMPSIGLAASPARSSSLKRPANICLLLPVMEANIIGTSAKRHRGFTFFAWLPVDEIIIIARQV